jgi:hypothetical protein
MGSYVRRLTQDGLRTCSACLGCTQAFAQACPGSVQACLFSAQVGSLSAQIKAAAAHVQRLKQNRRDEIRVW